MAIPVTIIFNHSLRTSEFPAPWKVSNVRPIFKNGSRSNVTNYRSIAKLAFLPKIFESLVCDHIAFFARPLIPLEQHGFVKHRSTITNLVEFTSFALNAMEKIGQVDVIYKDLSKAFDKVSHRRLCQKLIKLGFPPYWVEWIRSYLTNRTQRVKIGNTTSSLFNVLSGVPAGSHLGPLLFVLFVSDIGDVIKFSKFLMYADDIKLFVAIESIEDCLRLWHDVEAVAKWCNENGLPLNEKKCVAFSFTRKRTPIMFDYSINGNILLRPDNVSDLGVTMDSRLSGVAHIDKTIGRANALLGFIIRCAREFKDPYTIKTLFCTLVRSILEYASVIWTPTYAIHDQRIESVQKKFLLFALQNLFPRRQWDQLPPYQARLQLLNLQSLSTRRKITDLVFYYKLINGQLDVPNLLGQINLNTDINERRQDNLIRIPFHRTNYGQSSPLTRLGNLFNEFAGVIDFNMSINNLKNILIVHFRDNL